MKGIHWTAGSLENVGIDLCRTVIELEQNYDRVVFNFKKVNLAMSTNIDVIRKENVKEIQEICMGTGESETTKGEGDFDSDSDESVDALDKEILRKLLPKKNKSK